MSSSAPGGSFGRVFGLHGNGSEDSSKEEDKDDAEADEVDAEVDEAEVSAAIMSCGCMFRTSDTDSRSTVLLLSALSVATAVTIARLRITKRSSSFLESAAISCVCIFMSAVPDRVWKEFSILVVGAIVVVVVVESASCTYGLSVLAVFLKNYKKFWLRISKECSQNQSISLVEKKFSID